LAGAEPNYDEFVEWLSSEIVRQIRAQLCPEKFLERLRELRSRSEKLVYLFLIYNQPQTFTGIRRGLRLSRDAVDTALKRLMVRGLLVHDEKFRYWVRDLDERSQPKQDEKRKL